MKKILINSNNWQTRIVIIRERKIENVFFSNRSNIGIEKSFFKGKVSKVIPGIQTAFIDIGQPRSGFLHISEIDRDLVAKRLFSKLEDSNTEETQKSFSGPRKKVNINKIFKEKEEILVQVSKEPVYEKGAKLSTCFTIPGRFLVLMPNIPRIGISKKIDSREERQRLKSLVSKAIPKGMGVIIRTSSENKKDYQITRDLSYLLNTWETISNNYKKASTGEKIYEDIETTLQVIRDHLDDDVEAVICDSPNIQKVIYKFVKRIATEHSSKITTDEDLDQIFKNYNLEKQISQALEKKVTLKSGGSLIIETTEAMTVIDVNTGRYVGKTDLEQTLFNTNMNAAEEIVRQLKLRNIGGLIVIDFIDMESISNRQKLYNFFEKNLKERDKFQSVVLKVSEFGLVQMTRKRSGRTLIQQMSEACKNCNGTGLIRSIQTEVFAILRNIKKNLEEINKKDKTVNIFTHKLTFEYITNMEYSSILFLEKKYNCKIIINVHNKEDRSFYKVAIN